MASVGSVNCVLNHHHHKIIHTIHNIKREAKKMDASYTYSMVIIMNTLTVFINYAIESRWDG